MLDGRVFSLCMLLSALSSALSSPNSCGFPSEALCVLLTCMCFPGLMKPRALQLEITVLVLFSASFFTWFVDEFWLNFDHIFNDFSMVFASLFRDLFLIDFQVFRIDF